MGTPGREKDVTVPDGDPKGRRVSRRAWIVRIVLVLLVLAFAAPVSLTATPERCARCHEMVPYFDSWASSSHRVAAPNCLDCHVEPGLLNLVVYELTFYREIVAHFAGTEVTTGSGVPSSGSCLRDACHSLNREASFSGDLKIDHRSHVEEEGLDCFACHAGAVHEGVAGLERTPPMGLCQECHADEMEECTYCHAGKVVPEATDPH